MQLKLPYESRTHKIIQLHVHGRTRTEIADEMAISVDMVNTILDQPLLQDRLKQLKEEHEAKGA